MGNSHSTIAGRFIFVVNWFVYVYFFCLSEQKFKIIPEISLSQDMIVGFCGETEEDHKDTLELMKYVKYDFGFMFAYSERPGTLAAKKMPDDVPHSIK